MIRILILLLLLYIPAYGQDNRTRGLQQTGQLSSDAQIQRDETTVFENNGNFLSREENVNTNINNRNNVRTNTKNAEQRIIYDKPQIRTRLVLGFTKPNSRPEIIKKRFDKLGVRVIIDGRTAYINTCDDKIRRMLLMEPGINKVVINYMY